MLIIILILCAIFGIAVIAVVFDLKHLKEMEAMAREFRGGMSAMDKDTLLYVMVDIKHKIIGKQSRERAQDLINLVQYHAQ